MKICFLTKLEKPGVQEAITFTKRFTDVIDVFHGTMNDPFPSKAKKKKYDILFSYISPWVVTKSTLKNTKLWNINFHPGPPEYPGIGCFNFAVYDSAKQFGATAHIMNPKVDTGKIIGVKRFPMAKEESIDSLSIRTYSALLSLYKDVISFIFANNSLPSSDETWKRKPYRRSELEDLATINPTMSKDEIDLRIRSTYYPGKPAPFIKLCGHKFEYNPNR